MATLETESKKMDLIKIDSKDLSSNAFKLLKLVPDSAVWLANYVSPRTRSTYKFAVESFIAFAGLSSENDWKEVDQVHLIAWREHLTRNGASAWTVNTKFSAISQLFEHLCEKQIVSKNPTAGIKRPKVDKRKVKTPIMTRKQVRSMLEAPDTATLKGCRDHVMLSIFFFTGCRISEISKLKVRDFLMDGGYWCLEFTVKGGKLNRVAINQELQIAIQYYLMVSSHAEEKNAPLVLAIQRAELRRHLNPSQIHRTFYKYARMVGLPDGVTPHSARATFVTEALENNCPIESVQGTVAHAHISTTQMYDKRKIKHRDSASFKVHF